MCDFNVSSGHNNVKNIERNRRPPCHLGMERCHYEQVTQGQGLHLVLADMTSSFVLRWQGGSCTDKDKRGGDPKFQDSFCYQVRGMGIWSSAKTQGSYAEQPTPARLNASDPLHRESDCSMGSVFWHKGAT